VGRDDIPRPLFEMGKWGFFITIEGIEGSGKSTLAKGLKLYLENLGLKVVFTREPGGSSVGEKIRKILLSKEDSMDSMTEVFLFLAARRENVVKNILPALQNGIVVIADRYTDSTLAYQGYGRGLPIKILRRLNKIATKKIYPNLTFLIDIPPGRGLERKNENDFDRIEKENLDFHKRVREGYLRLARIAKKRIYVIDGTRDPAEILDEAKRVLYKRLVEKKKIKPMRGE